MSDSYAIITPVRNEAENLERLIESVAAQTVLPESWILVENGSADATLELAERATEAYSWIKVVICRPGPATERGAPIVHALHAGLEALEPFPYAVAQLDADLSLPRDYFERLLTLLRETDALGLAGGSCYELEGSEWRQRRVTKPYVWGAARMYRRECLVSVLPFEPRTGWDAIDVAQANALGWETRTLGDLPFYHHRPEASRERRRWAAWADQGRTSHFLGYRPSYLLMRSLYQSLGDPAALGLIAGFAGAAIRRTSRCSRPGVQEWVRAQQRLRAAPWRTTESRRQPDDRPSG